MLREAIKLTLPYPPSANRYWRVAKNRIYRSSEANAYIEQVQSLCNLENVEPMEGNIAVTLEVYRPRQSGDLDNRAKICLDAIQSYAYHNDNQIVEIHATRHDDKRNPRIELTIEEVTA